MSKSGRQKTMRRTNGEIFNRHQNQNNCLVIITAQQEQKWYSWSTPLIKWVERSVILYTWEGALCRKGGHNPQWSQWVAVVSDVSTVTKRFIALSMEVGIPRLTTCLCEIITPIPMFWKQAWCLTLGSLLTPANVNSLMSIRLIQIWLRIWNGCVEDIEFQFTLSPFFKLYIFSFIWEGWDFLSN